LRIDELASDLQPTDSVRIVLKDIYLGNCPSVFLGNWNKKLFCLTFELVEPQCLINTKCTQFQETILESKNFVIPKTLFELSAKSVKNECNFEIHKQQLEHLLNINKVEREIYSLQ